MFCYFVEFEFFVMFSFVPTRKPAMTVTVLFLVFLASMSFLNTSIRFFLSISCYTGSLWLTSSCILAAFFLPNDYYLWLCCRLLVLARVNGFLCVSKNSNFSAKFDSTHSCSIYANVLFRKGPLDIGILFGIYSLLFCHQT